MADWIAFAPLAVLGVVGVVIHLVRAAQRVNHVPGRSTPMSTTTSDITAIEQKVRASVADATGDRLDWLLDRHSSYRAAMLTLLDHCKVAKQSGETTLPVDRVLRVIEIAVRDVD